MNDRRGAWPLVAVLFAALVLVAGSGYGTLGVFFVPLARQFGWTHTRVSLLSSVLFGCLGWIGPLTGWLLDRLEAMFVMIAGTALTAAGFMIASQAHGFAPMLAAFALMGLGIGASTVLPASFVIANRFDARRGLAMGITLAGTTTGAMLMTMAASRMIALYGWRIAYAALAAPMLVLIPLLALTVRSRPQARRANTAASSEPALGLNLTQALRTRSFWMIAAAYFFYTFCTTAEFVHLIPFLSRGAAAGYGAAAAATIMSVLFGLASAGKPLFGVFADSLGCRAGLSINFLLGAAGVALILAARSSFVLIAAIVILGINLEGPVVLLPLVTADCLGLSSYGVIMGVFTAMSTLGATLGPLTAGRLFDATGGYAAAFELLTAMLVAGAAAIALCRPLALEQARFSVISVHEQEQNVPAD